MGPQVWEGLLKRHLLTDQKAPLALSLQAMVLLNNAVAACLAGLLALSYEIWLDGFKVSPRPPGHPAPHYYCCCCDVMGCVAQHAREGAARERRRST